jgi:hypothetical protein
MAHHHHTSAPAGLYIFLYVYLSVTCALSPRESGPLTCPRATDEDDDSDREIDHDAISHRLRQEHLEAERKVDRNIAHKVCVTRGALV